MHDIQYSDIGNALKLHYLEVLRSKWVSSCVEQFKVLLNEKQQKRLEIAIQRAQRKLRFTAVGLFGCSLVKCALVRFFNVESIVNHGFFHDFWPISVISMIFIDFCWFCEFGVSFDFTYFDEFCIFFVSCVFYRLLLIKILLILLNLGESS